MKKILLALGITGIAVGGVVALQPSEQEQIATQVLETHPKTIVWDKPTTDAEWAEDVKKENFDIRSTGVLETMIESHTAKLAREEKEFVKYRDCFDCVYYEFYEGFINSGWAEEDAVLEATKQANEAINNRALSIEKLKQSVERMEKEVELRSKGFVIVEGETEALGGSIPENRIRKIND